MLLLKLLEFLRCDVPVSSTIGSLSNDDGDGNENGKKAIDLYQQNNNFARDHAFLFISRRCKATKLCRGGNTRRQLPFSFPELWYSRLIRTQLKKFSNIWQIKWDGISAIKFEAARIHFLSDVFVAVRQGVVS